MSRGPHAIAEGWSDGHRTVVLSSPAAGGISAAFAPGAGMVGCSLLHRGEELLGLRGGLDRYVAERSTMGIPLLHPWANRLSRERFTVAGREVALEGSPLVGRDSAGLPIHGLLAGADGWELVAWEADERAARVGARFDFSTRQDLLAAFPFPQELALEVTLEGPTLTLRTAVTPEEDGAVPVSFGYHPYLRLPGVPREEWWVELPVRRRFVLDERMIPTGETDPVRIEPGPLGERTFDDGYADLEDPPRFLVSGEGRAIEVELLEGYPYAQVYAPADDTVICFEPMTAPTDALVSGGPSLPLAPPGEVHSAAFSVRVRE
jgi:aldose 1-epimerase